MHGRFWPLGAHPDPTRFGCGHFVRLGRIGLWRRRGRHAMPREIQVCHAATKPPKMVVTLSPNTALAFGLATSTAPAFGLGVSHEAHLSKSLALKLLATGAVRGRDYKQQGEVQATGAVGGRAPEARRGSLRAVCKCAVKHCLVSTGNPRKLSNLSRITPHSNPCVVELVTHTLHTVHCHFPELSALAYGMQ